MSDLPTLLQRLRSATGADRSIDREIGLAAGVLFLDEEARLYAIDRDNANRVYGGLGNDILIRHYTASLDAALALVQAKLPGNGEISVTRYSRSEGFVWEGEVETTNPKHRWITAEAPTAPLALLCALVQALIGEEEHG